MSKPEEPSGAPIQVAPSKYVGSAWRARFLRAPKIALEIAQRRDFVQLETVAQVKLGLKTGADEFFFLEHVPLPELVDDLVPLRGVAVLRGQDGWMGQVALADIRPAILNPHQLFVGEGRCLTIPKEPSHYYVCPRPGKLRFGLVDYVRLGELRGVHQGKLVQSNGGEAGWYSQVRSLVTSRWVLAYNSAYDYGAWFNPGGFVLNGRFVGVDALDREHSELLGATLNSTFVATGRLIEGVATGVEGALDVGPPAARRIMIPDFRRFSEIGRVAVLDVFREMLAMDVMPAAPHRDASVPRLRGALDRAILVALGLTAGQAAALLDRLYSSYGRWRGNIEDVEVQMRANRRQMSATGVNRAQNPADVAGRRVWEEIKHLLPLFPKAYLSAEEIVAVVNVPGTAAMPKTKPLFDVGVVRTKTKIIDLGSFERVRYVAMLREIGIVGNVEVPISAARAAAVADLFEAEQVRFAELCAVHAAKYVSGKEAIRDVMERARHHWFGACRKNALQRSTLPKPAGKLN